MIANRLLWVVAVLMAALMLVAGCGSSVEFPEGPRVVFEEGRTPRDYPEDSSEAEAVEQAWLEAEETLRPAEEATESHETPAEETE